jgi:heptosyltransferase II
MPSSATRGREWPIAKHREVLVRLPRGVRVVVLGTARDQKSLELVDELRRCAVDCVDGVGLWNLREVAHVLAGAEALLGCDTGLAHLAEAVGTPVVVVRGPTTRGVGFGPWRAESKSIESSLWCSPCSKDGSFCFRLSRQRCLRDLDSDVVFDALEGLLARPRSLPLPLPSLSVSSR